MDIKLLDGENQIRQGKANTSTLIGGKGGSLILTNQRLIFLSHGLNLTQGGTNIELKNIMSVSPAFTVSIFFPIPIPNSIKIRTQDGKVHKFVVTKRQEWISQITNEMNKPGTNVPPTPDPSQGSASPEDNATV